MRNFCLNLLIVLVPIFQRDSRAEYFTQMIQERERAKSLWKYSYLKCIDGLTFVDRPSMQMQPTNPLFPYPSFQLIRCDHVHRDIQAIQLEGRAVVTRMRNAKTPTWWGQLPSTPFWLAQIPAFIFEPEIWHFDPDACQRGKVMLWPTVDEHFHYPALPEENATLRHSLGEYLLNPKPIDPFFRRWNGRYRG